jgi:hypothetical protein
MAESGLRWFDQSRKGRHRTFVIDDSSHGGTLPGRAPSPRESPQDGDDMLREGQCRGVVETTECGWKPPLDVSPKRSVAVCPPSGCFANAAQTVNILFCHYSRARTTTNE